MGTHLNNRPIMILGYINSIDYPVSAAEIAEEFDYTVKQISTSLQTLSARNLVAPIGRRRSTKWRKVIVLDATDVSTPAMAAPIDMAEVPQIGLLVEHQYSRRTLP